MSEPLQAAIDQRPKKAMPEGRRFQPGVSGNKSGRRRVTDVERAARKLASDLTPDALKFLSDCWTNPRISWRDRIAAARAVLGCGHADKVADVLDPGAYTFVIHKIEGSMQPIPGVIASPIAAHVSTQQRTLLGPVDVIDVEETRVK